MGSRGIIMNFLLLISTRKGNVMRENVGKRRKLLNWPEIQEVINMSLVKTISVLFYSMPKRVMNTEYKNYE